jgi:hypothetical protein
MKYNCCSIDRCGVGLLEIGVELLLAKIDVVAEVLFRLRRLIDTKALSLRCLGGLLVG